MKLVWMAAGKDDFALNGAKALDGVAHGEGHHPHVRAHRRPARVGDLAAPPERRRAAAVQVAAARAAAQLAARRQGLRAPVRRP